MMNEKLEKKNQKAVLSIFDSISLVTIGRQEKKVKLHKNIQYLNTSVVDLMKPHSLEELLLKY